MMKKRYGMRLNTERTLALQRLLKNEFELDYSDEETQRAGLAIMRFVLVKERRTEFIKNKEGETNVKNTDNRAKDSKDKPKKVR
jgi:hypothetical protein